MGFLFYCGQSAYRVSESGRPAASPWLAAAAGGTARVNVSGAEPVFPTCSSRLRRGRRAGVAAGWAWGWAGGRARAACRGQTPGSGRAREAGTGLPGPACRRGGGRVGRGGGAACGARGG